MTSFLNYFNSLPEADDDQDTKELPITEPLVTMVSPAGKEHPGVRRGSYVYRAMIGNKYVEKGKPQ